MSSLNTPIEAVTMALYLALTAPTDETSHMVTEMAQQIADSAGLSEQEIDTAKALALAEFELELSNETNR
jgi:HD-GYP domain-containing protein (c-di-GMP phosphodiesterase class II)